MRIAGGSDVSSPSTSDPGLEGAGIRGALAQRTVGPASIVLVGPLGMPAKTGLPGGAARWTSRRRRIPHGGTSILLGTVLAHSATSHHSGQTRGGPGACARAPTCAPEAGDSRPSGTPRGTQPDTWSHRLTARRLGGRASWATTNLFNPFADVPAVVVRHRGMRPRGRPPHPAPVLGVGPRLDRRRSPTAGRARRVLPVHSRATRSTSW